MEPERDFETEPRGQRERGKEDSSGVLKGGGREADAGGRQRPQGQRADVQTGRGAETRAQEGRLHALGGGGVLRQRWRAEGTQGQEAGHLHNAWQRRGASEGEPRSKGPTAHLEGGMEVPADLCQGVAPRPQGGSTCQPLLLGSAPYSTLTLGLTLGGLDTGRMTHWQLMSLPPAHTPQSGLPASQQNQQLNNGAVWLQALILHRARLEAPTQHSCPQWRLPAKGPTSFPATHFPGAEA